VTAWIFLGKKLLSRLKPSLCTGADRLAQKLLPRRHLSLGVLLSLGFRAQTDLLEQILVVGVGFVGAGDRAFSGKSSSDSSAKKIATSASEPAAEANSTGSPAPVTTGCTRKP
jgi:hypothetical protein